MNRTAFYYDNRSNLKCVLDPDNGLTYYTYDALNRMTSVKNPWGELTQYAYSPGGRLLKRVLGNGTIAYYAYDAVGQVSKVQNVKSNLTTISSFEYQRNALGSPVSIKREDNSVTYYEYDAKQQLTKETQVNGQGQQVYGWTWDYDLAGNRLHQTFNGVTTAYTCNAANELTQETTAGATTYYSYDHCGNTTARIEPGATTQYHWDRENLMTQVDLPTGGHNYFTYDADAKRVEKRDGDGYTRFVYQGPDMLKLLQERDASDDLQAQYTMGNGLEAMRRGGVSSFYHFDWLGSTFELTNAAEAVTDTYLYNSWGEVLDRTGTTGNPHAYVGRARYHWSAAPALCLLGFRYYSPRLSTFLATDPAMAGRHYPYACSGPARYVDPAGLKCSVIDFRMDVQDTVGCTSRDIRAVDQAGQTLYHLTCKFRVRYRATVCQDGGVRPSAAGEHEACWWVQQKKGLGVVGGKIGESSSHWGPDESFHYVGATSHRDPRGPYSEMYDGGNRWRLTFYDLPGVDTLLERANPENVPGGSAKSHVSPLYDYVFPIEFRWMYRGWFFGSDTQHTSNPQPPPGGCVAVWFRATLGPPTVREHHREADVSTECSGT